MYKSSKYNYYVEYGQRVIYFNGLTGSSFSVSQKEHEKLKELSKDLISFHIQYTSLFYRLKTWGFIVDENIDEVDKIRYRNRQAVFMDKFYRLTINPTMDCIFNCWYCTQHTQNMGGMKTEIVEKVKKHIEIMIGNEKITGLHLDWFGGEPLMYFDEVVYPIAKHAFNLIEQNNLPHYHHITTNAYLITQEIATKMKEIKLNGFQITIDGDEKRHNKIRNVNGKPSYNRIMDNIILLCETVPDVRITLRLNYDNATLHKSDMQAVYEQIPQQHRNKIRLDFQRVWQTYDNNSTGQKANEPLRRLEKDVVSKGYSYSLSNVFSIGQSIRCYADRYYYAVINYDGRVYKCTAHFDKAIGILQDNGIIKWNDDIISSLYSKATFENEKCLACKHLPICMGQCIQKMKTDKCMMDYSEISYEQFIIDIYNKKMKQYANNIV
ncbi:MAG: radical SAM protein [Bacteroidales bacterium]|jgi:uncharacterized protein|nr:radical SAM protein [Bacteroidales bacterium]